MIAALLSPLGRWATVAVVLASVAAWGAWERGEAIRHAHEAQAARAIVEQQQRSITALETLAAERRAVTASLQPVAGPSMPRRLAMPVLLLSLSLLPLAGCAEPVTRAPFPQELLRVAPEPEVPPQPNDADVAEYMVALAEWGRGSAAQLRAIAEVVR